MTKFAGQTVTTAILGLLAVSSAGCERATTPGPAQGSTTTTSSTGGGMGEAGGGMGGAGGAMGGMGGLGGDGGMGGSGGSGGSMLCTTPDECPGEDNSCGYRTCLRGQCGMMFFPAGMVVFPQELGDCQELQCNG